MTVVDGFIGQYSKWYIIYTRIDINNIQTKTNIQYVSNYLLFCRTCMNIENLPTAAWICLICIELKVN